MQVKYRVTLTKDERQYLQGITSKGVHKAQKMINALILLSCDSGDYQTHKSTNEEIANILNIGMKRIDRVKQRFVEEGVKIALNGHKDKRVYDRKVDGDFGAHLVALSCSEPPDGFTRWSLSLLAGRFVELGYVQSVSEETAKKVSKKNKIRPRQSQTWMIPPEQDADFVAAMENVLELYKSPYNSAFPVVCMDESPKQLIGETKIPIAQGTGEPYPYDYEYERCGVCSVYMANEPLAGKRYVKITERKTKTDWASFMEEINSLYEKAEKIILVMDNDGTHVPDAFYEAYTPEKAKRLLDRFEFVYTPKHGNWLNTAELELNVLMGQCLDKRIDNVEDVSLESRAWQEHRNNKNATIDWQFSIDQARIKLKRVYPSFND